MSEIPSSVYSNSAENDKIVFNNSPIIRCTSKIPKHPNILAPKKLTKIDRLGKGTYGVVYTGRQDIEIRFSSTGKVQEVNHKDKSRGGNFPELAIKRNIIEEDTTYIGSIKELDLLSRLKGHPFIVDLLAISLENPFNTNLSPLRERSRREDNIFFIFEKGAYDGNTLIYGGNGGRTAYNYIKLAMIQSLIGLEYMHGKNIMHRDIKPSNMLWFRLGNNRLLKLCDFGLSKVMTSQEVSSPRVVTAWYRAPEIIFKWRDYTTKADVWSMGCVFFELLKKHPYLKDAPEDDHVLYRHLLERFHEKLTDLDLTSINKHGAYQRISSREFTHTRNMRHRISLPLREIDSFNNAGQGGTYDQFIDLIEGMMKLLPSERFTCTDALNHPFFEGYRDYIDRIRTKFPPERDQPEIIRIMSGSEIKWASIIFFTIYTNQRSLSWYKPRIIFQAFDIFHRYLQHLEENNIINPEVQPGEISKDNKRGRYHNKYETELRVMTCIYISIKYFTSMHPPCSFNELVTPIYKTPIALKEAEEFEMVLVTTLLRNRVYRPTIFEVAEDFGILLDTPTTGYLLKYFGSLPESNQYTYHDLFVDFNPDVKDNKPIFVNIDHIAASINSTPEVSSNETTDPVFSKSSEISMVSKSTSISTNTNTNTTSISTNTNDNRSSKLYRPHYSNNNPNNNINPNTSNFISIIGNQNGTDSSISDSMKDDISAAPHIPEVIIPIPTYVRTIGNKITSTRAEISKIGPVTGNFRTNNGETRIGKVIPTRSTLLRYKKDEISSENDSSISDEVPMQNVSSQPPSSDHNSPENPEDVHVSLSKKGVRDNEITLVPNYIEINGKMYLNSNITPPIINIIDD